MMEYRKARKAELGEIAVLLTVSFQDYGFFKMYIKNRERQFKFLHSILSTAVKAYYKKHIILVGVNDNKILSAALLKTPDKQELGLMDYVSAGGIKALLTGGIFSTWGFLKLAQEAGSACHSLPGRVWYLETLAVSASCQGQGLGSKMLKECIKPYIEKRGGGLLTLITNTELNRLFYKKNGFDEFHEMTLARNGKKIGNWSYRMKIDKLK